MLTPPVVTDDEQERDSRNRGSDLQDPSATTSQDNNPVVTFGATGTQSGADTSGLGATDLTVSGSGTDVATITDPNTVTLVVDLPPAADSGDPVPSLTAIDLNSGLLTDVDLSTNGPIAPPLPGVMLGSLDLMRRDLEQMFAPLNDDTGPMLLTAESTPEPPPPSWLLPIDLETTASSEELAAAFHRNQGKRITAFNEAQAERIEKFNEQLDEQAAADPLGALVGSAAFVVSELVNTAAVVVTEFVNYISFAVTNFIHGLSEWFAAPEHFRGVSGDPTTNQQYFRAQSSQNCVLMATAMVIGQLTGNLPTEDAIVAEAVATDSVANPGQKMYQGLQSQDGVDIKDAVKLMENHGITATLTSYDKAEGAFALRAVAFALEANKAVSVGLHGGTIWADFESNPLPDGVSASDHQVMVTGIDWDTRHVYLNDSGFGEDDNGVNRGKNMKVSLDAFMKAWQTDSYETIIAELAPVPGPASNNISGVLVSVT
ncbi:hypothetical protein [Mycobacterium sp. 2YAF39]|uniref:hypothetical protein n=1 Tax=Mycobacterium sp. 2YAF39 TaxID=3233033 RepID=UPI003F94499D